MNVESQRLLEDNLGLVYDYFIRHHIWDEDVKQSCIVKLCENMDRYDPAKSKLSTFINIVLDSAISNEIKKSKAQSRNIKENPTVSFDAPMSVDDDGGEVNLYNMLSDGFEDFEQLEFDMMYTDFIPFVRQNLTDKQNLYLDMLLSEYTVKDMAKATHTSSQNVSFAVKTLKKKILKYWEIYNE